MPIDYSVLFIVALMPVVSIILVVQNNPYHALVIRAILGAVATLVYAVLGGADVALTEAMIGTLLAVSLYIISVRSSQVLRLGILCGTDVNTTVGHEVDFNTLLKSIREVIDRYYLRLELIEYPDQKALNRAMSKQAIHAICVPANNIALPGQYYILSVRVARLFEIFTQELHVSTVALNFATPIKEMRK